jgi:RimJ/RimL family protein N-acetyltransferase
MEVIEKALELAGKAHDGQYRKGTKIPYITHPVAVGMILMKAGYSDHLIAAGILHDTVEDTEITLEEIERGFGPELAHIVAGCSEPDKSLSWEERKEHTIEFLKTASPEIRAVACADKLHNVRSILRDYKQYGDEIWTRFKRGKEQQEWYYQHIVESLGKASTFSLLEELKKEVNQLFNKGLVVEVRQLTSSDAQKYWALRLEALKQSPEAFSSSYEEAVRRENPIDQVIRNFQEEGNYTFGAFENNELIGMVTLLQEKSIKLKHRANIFAMYVTPAKQGLGVGKSLLTRAIDQAKQIHSIEKVNLTVVASNEKAKNLYAALGFKTFGVEEKALIVNGVYYDEEHMVLPLRGE